MVDEQTNIVIHRATLLAWLVDDEVARELNSTHYWIFGGTHDDITLEITCCQTGMIHSVKNVKKKTIKTTTSGGGNGSQHWHMSTCDCTTDMFCGLPVLLH